MVDGCLPLLLAVIGSLSPASAFIKCKGVCTEGSLEARWAQNDDRTIKLAITLASTEPATRTASSLPKVSNLQHETIDLGALNRIQLTIYNECVFCLGINNGKKI